jgi:hypothetical protein
MRCQTGIKAQRYPAFGLALSLDKPKSRSQVQSQSAKCDKGCEQGSAVRVAVVTFLR